MSSSSSGLTGASSSSLPNAASRFISCSPAARLTALLGSTPCPKSSFPNRSPKSSVLRSICVWSISLGGSFPASYAILDTAYIHI
ncbi:hypothetical protein OUZ56_032916 [Daphnia magna]|uniref:Uncharacterized protein n=1 Tax=Daphnia magna TaxID=35525 RepID=A0ABQ9ZX69_9CRUS|nr:hypothetical protein OUZ56_032916 [Daphnia magna]